MSDQTHHESEAWIVAKKEMRALRDENAALRKRVAELEAEAQKAAREIHSLAATCFESHRMFRFSLNKQNRRDAKTMRGIGEWMVSVADRLGEAATKGRKRMGSNGPLE